MESAPESVETVKNQFGRLDLEASTDVTFQLDNGDSVKCHRSVLARASPYLKALFVNQVQDEYKMSADEFNLIYDWAYKKKIPENVDLNTLTMADFLLAESLLRECTNDFLKKATPDERSELIGFATTTDSCISELLVSWMASNFDSTLSWMNEFCLLPFEEVVKVLQAKTFFVSSEMFLWLIVKTWVKADLDQRKRHLQDLTTFIKFLQMSTGDFDQVRREIAALAGVNFDQDLPSWMTCTGARLFSELWCIQA